MKRPVCRGIWVASTKVRIPDVCVFPRHVPIKQVFTRPRLITIEVLSPEDRQSRIDERLSNFRDFGLPVIWVVDQEPRTGCDLSDRNWVRKKQFEAANSPIYLSLAELFKKIEDDKAN